MDIVNEILLKKHKKSGGKCGTYLTEILQITGKESKELRNELNNLFKEKKIKIREGIHGKLIFPTKKLQ